MMSAVQSNLFLDLCCCCRCCSLSLVYGVKQTGVTYQHTAVVTAAAPGPWSPVSSVLDTRHQHQPGGLETKVNNLIAVASVQ